MDPRRTSLLDIRILLELGPPDVPMQETKFVFSETTVQLVLVHLLEPLRALLRQSAVVVHRVRRRVRDRLVVRLVMVQVRVLRERAKELAQAQFTVALALEGAELEQVVWYRLVRGRVGAETWNEWSLLGAVEASFEDIAPRRPLYG